MVCCLDGLLPKLAVSIEAKSLKGEMSNLIPNNLRSRDTFETNRAPAAAMGGLRQKIISLNLKHGERCEYCALKPDL
jgi:hypothetical protein